MNDWLASYLPTHFDHRITLSLPNRVNKKPGKQESGELETIHSNCRVPCHPPTPIWF